MKNNYIAPKIYVDVHGHDNLYQGTRTFVFNLYSQIALSFPSIEVITFGSMTKPHFSKRHIAIDLSSPVKRLLIPYDKFTTDENSVIHYQNFSPVFSRSKVVVTIHDILPITHPQYFNKIFSSKFRLYTQISINRSSHINCVSEFTKRSLIKHYSLKPENVTVVPNGVNTQIFQKHTHERAKSIVENVFGIKNYIIVIGRIELRKNIPEVLAAVETLRNNGFPDLSIVLVGSIDDYSGQKCIETQRYLNKNWVHHLTNIDDEQKALLIRAANLLVFPSLAEGFGIPPLEAMAAEIPCIVANRTAPAEIYRNCSILYEPGAQQLEKRIMEILVQPEYFDNFIAEGLKLADEYNWENCAKKFINSLQLKNI